MDEKKKERGGQLCFTPSLQVLPGFDTLRMNPYENRHTRVLKKHKNLRAKPIRLK